jgi:hypothetical protein
MTAKLRKNAKNWPPSPESTLLSDSPGSTPCSTSASGSTSKVMAMATTASRKVTKRSSPRSVRTRAG